MFLGVSPSLKLFFSQKEAAYKNSAISFHNLSYKKVLNQKRDCIIHFSFNILNEIFMTLYYEPRLDVSIMGDKKYFYDLSEA